MTADVNADQSLTFEYSETVLLLFESLYSE